MNRTLRKILTIVLFVTLAVTANAVVIFPDSAVLGKYPYVRFLEKGADIQLSDNEFYNISRKVVFPVNEHVLPKNSPLLKEIENEIVPIINKDSLTIRHLMIRGAASPEGPYDLNKSLGEKRGKALFDFIKKAYLHFYITH